MRTFLSFVLLILFLSCGENPVERIKDLSAEGPPTEHYDRYWNDMARFMAGMQPEEGSVLKDYEHLPQAVKHRQFFDAAWSKVEKEHLSLMRPWVAKEITPKVDAERFVFYAFSGPDFLNISTCYPDAKEYIFFGLESAGTPPDIQEMEKKKQVTKVLSRIQKSLGTIMKFSFFRTIEMMDDISARSEIDGAIHLMIVFAARQNYRVLNVESVVLGDDQKLYPLKKNSKLPSHIDDKIQGISMLIENPRTKKRQSVTYFSINMEDKKIAERPFFFEYVKSKGPFNAYLKAASYLMHWGHFSTIRKFMLDRAVVILEDDSGIPLKYFDKGTWNVTYYGEYTSPIPMFKKQLQKDLAAEYKKRSQVKPLPFGTGYMYVKGKSNLLLAVRKDGAKSIRD